MNLDLTIGQLATAIEQFTGAPLKHNCEVPAHTFGIYVPTPAGKSLVQYFIKKENLKSTKIILENGMEVITANKHIVVDASGSNVYVEDLTLGSKIQTITGPATVVKLVDAGVNDCFDIGIDYPHLYYDAAGFLHHNTIMTAVLSHKCEPYGRTLVVVPSKDLVIQTEQDYINMGLDVGVFFGTRKEYTKTHTICTWQSLNSLFKNTKNGEAQIPFDEFIDGVVCVIIDECHGIKADALLTMLTGVMAKIPIRWGVTGTIPKEEFEKRSLQVAIGEVVGGVKASDLQDRGVLSNCHVNVIQMVEYAEFKAYPQELKYLLETKERLEYMATLIAKISESGNTLVLVDRVEAGKTLAGLIPDAVFLSGATKSANRKEQYDSISTTDNTVTICTYGIAAVGINVPRIFNLVLIEPGKSFIRVIQSIGRGLRKADDKDFVNIYDITSTCKFAKRHLTKRKAFYNESNYQYSVAKVEWQ